jgi:hypothetical protein
VTGQVRPPILPTVIRPPVIRLGNEFSEVVVELVRTRNGARLRISVPSSGREISLCPLELESLTWQDPEFFSRLLATPHGPEGATPPGQEGET